MAYALTVAMLMLMKPLPTPEDSGKGRLWDDLLVGLSYIRGHRAIVSLIALGVVAGLFAMPYATLLPIFASRILQGGVESYSLLLLSAGGGGLVGTLALALFGNMKNSVVLQLAAGVGLGVGLAVFSQTSWLPASVAMIAVVGGSSAAFGTINNALLQSLVADEYRGRVISIHQLGWGASAIGGLLMGFLAHSVSPTFALTLCGLVTAVATGALTLSAAGGRVGASQALAGGSLGAPKATGDDR